MKTNNDLIDVDFAPEIYTIDLNKQHFEKSYAIYILELLHNDIKYYFIENLIDSKGISVQYPFVRLANHFEEIKSSKKNDLFKYILNQILEPDKDPNRKITDKHKALVEKFLLEAKIRMLVYPLLKFNFKTLKSKTHKENVRQVKNFEQQIIRLFDMHSKKMINKEIPEMYVRYDDIRFPKIWHQIKKDFYL